MIEHFAVSAITSDMSSERITIRTPEELGARLRHRSRTSGQTESDWVRIALEKYLGRSGREWSAFELAEQAGLIGCVPGSGPASKDLSTYTRYFNSCGKDRSRSTGCLYLNAEENLVPHFSHLIVQAVKRALSEGKGARKRK